MRLGRYALVCALLLSAVLPVAVYGASVGVAFWKCNSVYLAERSVSAQDLVSATLQALLDGPNPVEASDGVTSAIPPGTGLIFAGLADGFATVDLSAQALANGSGDWEIEQIYRQIRATLRQFYPDTSVAVMVEGRPLWSYAPPKPKIQRRASVLEAAPNAGALSGHSVTLSPGHGLYWLSTYWTTQRGGSCGYQPEDYHNIWIARYLKTFLENDGALVKECRDTDMDEPGTGPNGQPWWKYGSYVWLWHSGYPASVFASSTGDNPPGSAANNESSDDIRARPLASDYDNTDIYLSLHTNALSGYCVGGSCPTGSETYYDASAEHADWAAVSQQLANNVNGGIMAAIQGNVNNIPYGDWTCHGTCVKNSNGAYGEIRIPNRAATLTELAFHDTCDRDAPLIEDPFFQSVAMWGMYKGVCDYFGVAPTYGVYGAEYVSDTIPATIIGGRTVSVSITMRNKGVVWQEARAFRLGAVDDSDPFATGRQTLSGSIDPNATYTFTFSMTAPRTEGDYSTDWRMVRDGFAWFGDTLTKTVHVSPPTDNEPPSTPQNSAATASGTTFIDLSWDASTDNEVVTGYNIYRGGVKIKFLTGTTYRDTGLVPGTPYTYQVTAMDASSNESGLSNQASATTLYDITPPAAPTNVTAVGITNSRIEVSWTAPWENLTITSYRVFRDGVEVGTVTGAPPATSYADTGLAAGSVHTYRVSAVDQSANQSSQSAPAVGRTIDLGNQVLWSDNLESYANQAAFEAVWPMLTAPGLAWTAAQSASPTHSAEETATAMRSIHDLTPAQSQISVGTFLEFKLRDPAGATNVRHYGEIRSYTGGGHSGTLSELLAMGAYNAGGVNTSKYSGRALGPGWFTLSNSRTGGWHTMRIDVVADTSNPINPGKGLATWSVDGQAGSANENIPIAWLPFTSIVLGSGLSSTNAGSYYYDDIRYGIQGTLQRTSGPDLAEATCGAVTVTWKTDLDSSSMVDYGLTASYGLSAVDPTPTKNHSITLTGLNPASTYHFRVTSTTAGKTDSVSDDYTFSTAASSLAQLKGLPTGASSGACGVVVSSVLTDGFYVQDTNRVCGMKVLGMQQAAVGSIVTVSGDLATQGGERVLANAIVRSTGTGDAPRPFALKAKDVGGASIGANIPGLTGGVGTHNIGLLVKVWGRVTEAGADVFWVDDGSALSAASGKTGLKITATGLTVPAVGQYVVVTGISGAESIGGSIYPVLRPRGDADIVTVPH